METIKAGEKDLCIEMMTVSPRRLKIRDFEGYNNPTGLEVRLVKNGKNGQKVSENLTSYNRERQLLNFTDFLSNMMQKLKELVSLLND